MKRHGQTYPPTMRLLFEKWATAARLPQGRSLTCRGQKEHGRAARMGKGRQALTLPFLIWRSWCRAGVECPPVRFNSRNVPPVTEHSHKIMEDDYSMDEYKAKIEVVLRNDNRVDMVLNGNVNDLINLMADVLTQTIVDFSDTKNEAEKAMENVRCSMPTILEEFWNDKITNGKAAQSAAAGAAQNVMQEA